MIRDVYYNIFYMLKIHTLRDYDKDWNSAGNEALFSSQLRMFLNYLHDYWSGEETCLSILAFCLYV